MGLTVDWAIDSPGAAGELLAIRVGLPRPDPDADEVLYPLDGGTFRLRRAGDRTAAAFGLRRLPDEATPIGVGLAGVGWATVDLERARAEVGTALELRPEAFRPAHDDSWLGARAIVASVDRTAIVLLEPTTEGRVAALLARHAEGPTVVWLTSARPAHEATRPGPLGPAELVLGSAPWGPFVLRVVDGGRAGTIER